MKSSGLYCAVYMVIWIIYVGMIYELPFQNLNGLIEWYTFFVFHLYIIIGKSSSTLFINIQMILVAKMQ